MIRCQEFESNVRTTKMCNAVDTKYVMKCLEIRLKKNEIEFPTRILDLLLWIQGRLS